MQEANENNIRFTTAEPKEDVLAGLIKCKTNTPHLLKEVHATPPMQEILSVLKTTLMYFIFMY